jgi:hypothetical protein
MIARGVAVAAWLVVVAAGAASCKRAGTVDGSCDYRPSDTSCWDAYDAKEGKAGCAVKQGKWSDKPCDKTGAAAGCKNSHGITWHYDPLAKSMPELVALSCFSEDTLVMPDGTPRAKPSVAPTPQKTPDQLNDYYMSQYSAKVEPKVEAIEKLAAKLPAPVPKDGVKLDGQPALTTKSVGVVHAEDLRSIYDTGKVAYRIEHSDTLNSCARVVRKRAKSAEPSPLSDCAGWDFLLVVRTASVTEPAAAGTTHDPGKTTHFFTPGKISGDVLVFRIDGGKLLGGYSFAAKNPDTMDNPDVGKLQKDLHFQLAQSIGEGLKKVAPASDVHVY